MFMSKGGFRPNSGRKKGSIPWNKGIPMSEKSKIKMSSSKKGKIAWNKGKKSPSTSVKMIGNKNGKGNKGRKFKSETLKKMSLAKIGKPSNNKKEKVIKPKQLKLLLKKDLKKYTRQKNERWVLKNYDKKLWFNNQRRVKRLGNGGSHTLGEWETLKAQYNFTCPNCHRKEPEVKLTRDHIIPLSKGGSDNIENIQPLCGRCNCSKHTEIIKYEL